MFACEWRRRTNNSTDERLKRPQVKSFSLLTVSQKTGDSLPACDSAALKRARICFDFAQLYTSPSVLPARSKVRWQQHRPHQLRAAPSKAFAFSR